MITKQTIEIYSILLTYNLSCTLNKKKPSCSDFRRYLLSRINSLPKDTKQYLCTKGIKKSKNLFAKNLRSAYMLVGQQVKNYQNLAENNQNNEQSSFKAMLEEMDKKQVQISYTDDSEMVDFTDTQLNYVESGHVGLVIVNGINMLVAFTHIEEQLTALLNTMRLFGFNPTIKKTLRRRVVCTDIEFTFEMHNKQNVDFVERFQSANVDLLFSS